MPDDIVNGRYVTLSLHKRPKVLLIKDLMKINIE